MVKSIKEVYKCEICGITRMERFVKKDQLLRMGISVEEIENI